LKISRDQLKRIRRRHRGYRIALIYELLFLLLLPVAQLFTPLLSLLMIGLALVSMVLVYRFSGMRQAAPMLVALGCSAIALEVIWRTALVLNPMVGRLITLPHVVVWTLYLLAVVIRGVRALIREPFVTMSVLQGAASGYLTLGIAGGVMLTSVWVLQPTAFVASALPSLSGSSIPNAAIASALMTASFGLLTSAGTAVINTRNVTVEVLATLITIAGQLYLAILIGLILGRVQRRS
jgi:hypothetical protein